MNANPTTNARFTVADMARANDINPKIARRRLRDRARKAAEGVAEMPNVPARKEWTDGRLSWEFQNRQDLRVLDIIAPAS